MIGSNALKCHLVISIQTFYWYFIFQGIQKEKEIVSINSEIKEITDSEIKEIADSEIKEIIDQEVVEKEPEVIKQVSCLLVC